MNIIEVVSQPILPVLLSLYGFVGNFGLSIALFTIATRVLLLPFTIPTIKAQKKMQSLQPKIKELRTKYKTDPQRLQQEQMKLYKEQNVNPFGGCLPYIVQIGVMIVLYNVLSTFLAKGEVNGVVIQTQFLWLNLAKPDSTFILPLLTGISQLFMSLMVLPGAESHDLVPNNSTSKKIQQENKKEEDSIEMAESMQKQMMFLMPAVTVFMALKLPSGVAVYWIVTTVFSIVQQWVISGPGALALYWNKYILRKK